MRLTKYQWAALVAALLVPSLLLAAAGRKSRSHVQPFKNLRAFLLMIQYSEGTIGENAYRMLYGGGLFSDLSKHPNIAITKWGITSTAAGAYGFLNRVWVELSRRLQLPDFSPLSQDKAAVELIREKGALVDVLSGKIQAAVYKCRKVWASLPGAGYGQHERSISELLNFYIRSGGQLTT